MHYDVSSSGTRTSAGDYQCIYCGDSIYVGEAQKIPVCRSCGGNRFYVLDVRAFE